MLTTGFLDGLNPCAFAVLLFFIAFLFTIRRTAFSIWAMGLVYVAAIYLAYFLIGLGLMQAVLFAGEHHLMARIGSWLVIVLGLVNVKDYFFPQLPIHLRIPTIAHGTIQDWLRRATYPAAAIGGFLAGLCAFPCSGGIYVAIVGLLAARTTYWQGAGYLGLYNLMFVAPLLLILAGVGNRRVMHRIRLVEQSSRRWVRLVTGLAMIGIGAVILIWFVCGAENGWKEAKESGPKGTKRTVGKVAGRGGGCRRRCGAGGTEPLANGDLFQPATPLPQR